MGGHVTANPSHIYPASCLLSPFVSVSSCQISVRSETLNHYLLCRDQTGAAASRAACQSWVTPDHYGPITGLRHP